jgi:hypothetical protein
MTHIMRQPTVTPLRVELRETGGIANLDRSIVLDGPLIVSRDRGAARSRHYLQPEQVSEVADLISDLEHEEPKRFYGDGHVSDATRVFLTYTAGSNTTTVQVSTDPSDTPPEPFRALVRLLKSFAS